MDEQNRTTFDDVIKDHPELDTPEYREIWEKDREHREAMCDVFNSFNEIASNVNIYPPITGSTGINGYETKKESGEEFNQHLNEISEFVASFDGCSVSPEIMGEWNVIKKEISDYLFKYNIQITGECPHMRKFFVKEKEHLDSIKNKLGPNAIEYQMICSLVAEAIILDIESCIILEAQQSAISPSPSVKRLSYQAMLKDSLNVLDEVSSLNMEYQYKYEKFTPFYKSLSEKGRLAGLAKDESAKSKSGCFSIIVLAIISTLLCSFVFI